MHSGTRAAVCAAVCLCGAAVTEVGAFAPPAVAAVRAGAVRRAAAVPELRPWGQAQHMPARGQGREARGGAARGLEMAYDRSRLVTQGDIWRELLNEDGTADLSVIDESELSSENDLAYATEELSILASEVVAPIKKVAGAVGSALWSKLSPSPDEDEIQRNLRVFAKSHSGAVGTPMGEEELEKEVRYLGMFPDLVDAMLEAQEEQSARDEASAAGLSTSGEISLGDADVRA
jgi:hypothetical protein